MNMAPPRHNPRYQPRQALVLPRRRLIRFRAVALAMMVVGAMLFASVGSQRLAQRHAALAAIDARVAAVRAECAELQTELDTRSSLPEVARWNGALRLSTPTTPQYVHGLDKLRAYARPAPPAHAYAAL